MLETIVGFVALGISIFAVAIAIVFYFKSDNLYKEMLKFITEIRTYSVGMYKDTFGMVKEAWPYGRQKGGREKISQETIKEKEKIKEEITKDIMAEITKIKEINREGVQAEQLKEEMASLEQKFTKAIDEAFKKMDALDLIKERINKIDQRIRLLLDLGDREKGLEAGMLVDIVSSSLEIPKGFVFNRIVALKEKNILDFEGEILDPSTRLKIKEINLKK